LNLGIPGDETNRKTRAKPAARLRNHALCQWKGDFILATDALRKSLDAAQHLGRRGSKIQVKPGTLPQRPGSLNEKDVRS
jgi:hypothetical protein